ncbi:MAG: tetratricopeptide repeat protein [Polyangiaceae bacterium]|nr:tetratricopeptide repeat protein [Polyangiaceae bacterium]
MLRRLTWIWGLGALFWALPSSAEPSLWEAARDPQAAVAEKSYEGAQRMFARSLEAERFSTRSAKNLERASLALAELAEGHGSAEVDYFLGHLLSLGPDLKRAETVLRRALARDPASPLARRAWFDLGILRAKAGDSKGEYDSYTRALDTSWERGLRGNLYLNRAESAMVQGRLTDALRDYQQAVKIGNEPSLQALAYWGISIVQDRLGDLPAALQAATLATKIYPGALDLPSVFFVPRYDIHYYRALTWMALAKDAAGAGGRAEGYARASQAWEAYLAEAVPAKAEWVVNARLHLKTTERERKAAEKELAKSGKQAAPNARPFALPPPLRGTPKSVPPKGAAPKGTAPAKRKPTLKP